MALISITRLRLRSPWHLPHFLWLNERSARQLRTAPGFIGGKLLVDARRTFWTVTAWSDEPAMRAYRDRDAHRAAMAKLVEWCDEASVAHWSQNDTELPDWGTAHRRLIEDGRASKVRHPAPTHAMRQFPPPRVPTRLERSVGPAQR